MEVDDKNLNNQAAEGMNEPELVRIEEKPEPVQHEDVDKPVATIQESVLPLGMEAQAGATYNLTQDSSAELKKVELDSIKEATKSVYDAEDSEEAELVLDAVEDASVDALNNPVTRPNKKTGQGTYYQDPTQTTKIVNWVRKRAKEKLQEAAAADPKIAEILGIIGSPRIFIVRESRYFGEGKELDQLVYTISYKGRVILRQGVGFYSLNKLAACELLRQQKAFASMPTKIATAQNIFLGIETQITRRAILAAMGVLQGATGEEQAGWKIADDRINLLMTEGKNTWLPLIQKYWPEVTGFDDLTPDQIELVYKDFQKVKK